MEKRTDLEDLSVQWLIRSTRKTHDSTELIKWLRDGSKITPELTTFIADILEGKVSAKLKKKE